VLTRVVEGRTVQKQQQVKRLQALGYRVTWEEVMALAGGVPGRPHIADVLVANHPEEFPDRDRVFATVLRTGGPVHVPRPFSLRLEDGVRLIRRAGGVPVLAHPGLYTEVRDLEGMIRRAARLGVLGLEVWYPYEKTRVYADTPPADVERLRARFESLAGELGLVKTGGSDFHGLRKLDIQLGEQGLTEQQYELLLREVERLVTSPCLS